jgi:hypothetical protein
MIRWIVLLCAPVAACAPPQAARCDLTVARDVTFSAAGEDDRISVSAQGPSCDKTIGVFEVRNADGYPLWSWSAPLAHAFGDVFEADDEEAVQAFLTSWANAEITTTQAAPAWAELGQSHFGLDQLTYSDIRARDLPMLCHFSGTARQLCVFWEPSAGGAGLLFEREIAEVGE